ncbi:MAG: phosphoribosylpyrophosphate synthetase [Bacteroidetes bacterium]|nr:MAG: phosphoribosylpyrophosphate synthetase [Bacteroidota bacterium]
MYAYDTVSEAIKGLKDRGYNLDFNIEKDHLFCSDKGIILRPQEFEIAEFYRFEGISDPADEAIVYGIESKKGEKGVLVNGYGAFGETTTDELIKKLHVQRN